MDMVTIIGRGHSGTRAISRTLKEAGVFMGEPLNESYDLVPPGEMYEACRVLAQHVEHRCGLEWDFSKLHTVPIDPPFTELIESYLSSVLDSDAQWRGWKIPETTLAFPWIRRMFPDIHYIYWVRNPRDCILGGHKTDDLRDFGIECPPTDDDRHRRAVSWKYQYDLMRNTPRPARVIEVRFEDFVLDQRRTLDRLSEFLGLDLPAIPVKPEAVGRYEQDEGVNYFDFFEPAMHEHGYEIHDASGAAREHP